MLGSLVLAATSLVPAWLTFLDNGKHATATAAAYALWVAIAVAGLAAAALSIGRSKDGSLRASSWLSLLPERLESAGQNVLSRYVVNPAVRIVDSTERAVPAADAAVARISHVSGRYTVAALHSGDVGVLVVMAVLLSLLVALISPGVLR